MRIKRLVEEGLLVPKESRPFHLLSLQCQHQLTASSTQSYVAVLKNRISISPSPKTQVLFSFPGQSIRLKPALNHGNDPGDLML